MVQTEDRGVREAQRRELMELAKLREHNAQAAPHSMFAIDTGEGPRIFWGRRPAHRVDHGQ